MKQRKKFKLRALAPVLVLAAIAAATYLVLRDQAPPEGGPTRVPPVETSTSTTTTSP